MVAPSAGPMWLFFARIKLLYGKMPTRHVYGACGFFIRNGILINEQTALVEGNISATIEKRRKIAEEIELTPGIPSAMRRHFVSFSLADAGAKAFSQAGADATSAAKRAKRSRDVSASDGGTGSLPADGSAAAAANKPANSALSRARGLNGHRQTPPVPHAPGSRSPTGIAAGGGPSKVSRSESQTTVRDYLRCSRCGMRLNYCVKEHDVLNAEPVSMFPNMSFKILEDEQCRVCRDSISEAAM